MFPSDSETDTTDLLKSNAELSRECEVKPTWTTRFTNAAHLIFGKFHEVVLSTSERSAFVGFIRHVIGVGAQEQMIGIDAFWLIAVMENLYSWWDRSSQQLPHDAMRVLETAVQIKLAVAEPMACFANPQPTRICFVDATPEAFWRGRHRRPSGHYHIVIQGEV